MPLSMYCVRNKLPVHYLVVNIYTVNTTKCSNILNLSHTGRESQFFFTCFSEFIRLGWKPQRTAGYFTSCTAFLLLWFIMGTIFHCILIVFCPGFSLQLTVRVTVIDTMEHTDKLVTITWYHFQWPWGLSEPNYSKQHNFCLNFPNSFFRGCANKNNPLGKIPYCCNCSRFWQLYVNAANFIAIFALV